MTQMIYLQNRTKSWTWRDMFAMGGSGERGIDREFGVGRCRLLHLEWMGKWGPAVWHRELYPVSWVRTWWKMKKNGCVWVIGSLCCTEEIEGTL